MTPTVFTVLTRASTGASMRFPWRKVIIRNTTQIAREFGFPVPVVRSRPEFGLSQLRYRNICPVTRQPAYTSKSAPQLDIVPSCPDHQGRGGNPGSVGAANRYGQIPLDC